MATMDAPSGNANITPHHRQRSASPARAVRVTTASQEKFPAAEPLCTMRRATGETRNPSGREARRLRQDSPGHP